MKLVIIRGPSGSGKSTIARHLGGVATVNWFEADLYFMKTGFYRFVANELGAAHSWCQNRVNEACIKMAQKQEGLTIVSNTSTTLVELNNYLAIAKKHGIPCEVIRTPEPWNPAELVKRNEHNVPLEVLKKQIMRYTPVDGETEWSDLSIFKTGVSGK